LKGAVRVYEFNKTQDKWNQMGADIIGFAAEDYTGCDVDISADGTTIAWGASGFNSQKGLVKIFKWSSTAWEQLGQDITNMYRVQLGSSVALSKTGTRVGIGLELAYYNEVQPGAMAVFDLVSNTWQQVGTDLMGDVMNHFSRFGFSVDISDDGKRIIAGAPNAKAPDQSLNGFGAVYVFEENATDVKGWSRIGSLYGDLPGDRFGSSVTMSGDGNIIALGAHLSSDKPSRSGRVSVYNYNASAAAEWPWTQHGANLYGSLNLSWFGNAQGISRDGGRLIVGAPRADHPPFLNSGEVYVYALRTPAAAPTSETSSETSLGLMNAPAGCGLLLMLICSVFA
jgi:hypothetical protein